MSNNISLNDVKNGAFFWLVSLMRLLKIQKKMNTKNLSLSQTQSQILVLKYIIKLTMIAQDLALLYLEISIQMNIQ